MFKLFKRKEDLNEIDFFKSYFKNLSNIDKIEKVNNGEYFQIDFRNLKIKFRDTKHSDYLVLHQVFIQEEYRIIHKIIEDNNYDCKVIIDAGANVGYTTIFFNSLYKNSKIFSIEPEENNIKLAKENLALNDCQKNVKFYEAALHSQSNILFDVTNDFRDGLDWAYSIKENINGIIPSITIGEIISSNNLDVISILKIDIEGAERYIFREGSDLNFLKITKLIAIEVHEEYIKKSDVVNLLIVNKFFILSSGELIIGINIYL